MKKVKEIINAANNLQIFTKATARGTPPTLVAPPTKVGGVPLVVAFTKMQV